MYLPKELRNGDVVAKQFHPFNSYLPLNFVLKFKKGKSFLKGLTLPSEVFLSNWYRICHSVRTLTHTFTKTWMAVLLWVTWRCQSVLCTSQWGMTLISLTLTSVKIYTITPHNHLTSLPVQKVYTCLKEIYESIQWTSTYNNDERLLQS